MAAHRLFVGEGVKASSTDICWGSGKSGLDSSYGTRAEGTMTGLHDTHQGHLLSCFPIFKDTIASWLASSAYQDRQKKGDFAPDLWTAGYPIVYTNQVKTTYSARFHDPMASADVNNAMPLLHHQILYAHI